jgi:hypothetical protein
MEPFEDGVDAVLAKLRETLIRKNRAYGSGNISIFGERGIVVRASDKMERLRTLAWDRRGDPEWETVEDTWLDLAGYSVLALMLREGALTRVEQGPVQPPWLAIRDKGAPVPCVSCSRSSCGWDHLCFPPPEFPDGGTDCAKCLDDEAEEFDLWPEELSIREAPAAGTVSTEEAGA